MANEKELTIIQKALNAAYDKALDGIPGMMGAEDLARDYQRSGKPLGEQVDELINWQCSKTVASGFLTSLGGPLTLAVAIPADLSATLFVHLRMIACIAHMGGYDIRDDRVKTFAFLCLCTDSAREAVRDIGQKVGVKVGQKLIDRIPGAVLIKINKMVGMRLLTKAGEKGVINFAKLVPVLGGLVSGAINMASTKAVGRTAKRMFIIDKV